MNLIKLPFFVLPLFLFSCQTTPKTTPHTNPNSLTFDSNSLTYPSIIYTWRCSKHQTDKEAKEDVIKLEGEYSKYLKLGKSKRSNANKFSKLESEYGCQVAGLKVIKQKIRLEAISERGDTVRVTCPNIIPSGVGESAEIRAESALKYVLDQQEQMYRMVRSYRDETDAFADETEVTMLEEFGCTHSFLIRPIAHKRGKSKGNHE